MRWDVALCLFSLLLFSLADHCQAFLETRGCNRTVRNSVGWIRWTGRMGRCTVRIRAPLRDPQVIELKIRRLQVGFLKDARCEGAYVQFSDEMENLDDQTGRYCGHVTGNATRLFLRKGPDLTVVMDSDEKFAAENPVIFSAQFSVLPARLAVERHHNPTQSSSTDCPLECTIRNDRRTCRLVSPGYPGVYPRGIRCRIALESSTGRFKIGGIPEDLFNLMNYTSQNVCHTENCEEHVENDEILKSRLERSVNPFKETSLNVSRVSRRYRGHGQRENPKKDKLPRLSRRADRDEEDEFVIGNTATGSRRNRNRRRKRKRLRAGSTKLKSPYTHDDDERRTTMRNMDTEIPSHDRRDSLEQPPRRFRNYDERFYNRVTGFAQRKSDDRDIANLKYNPNGTPDKSRRNFHLEGSNVLRVYEQRYLRRNKVQERLGSPGCVGDYLSLLENVNGKIFEISKFCGEGHVPHILSRGKNIIVEFSAEKDGTIMHDGFQLTLQETDAPAARNDRNCEFLYKSSERSRESVKSQQSWYPPNTLCSYKFLGKPSERVSAHLKIVRNNPEDLEHSVEKRNFSLNYCSGNEILVYNGPQANDSSLMWSYCDVSHRDINNIQVPLVSSGNTLLIQYYSAKGSYNGQEFIYTISYKFLKRPQNSTIRRQIQEDFKPISLRPVNFSSLNLNDTENCNCDFADRIGSFKTWFMALVVLGVISFLGAVLTIIALLAKCMKMKNAEKKLLQTPKR